MPQWFQQGGPVMWLLLFCSIVAIGIIIERIIFWWRERKRVNLDEIGEFFREVHRGNMDQANKLAEEAQNPVLSNMMDALSHSDDPRMHALHEALELEIDRALDRTQAFLPGLDTIVSLSPLLGIFGTVIGIIKSFAVIGQTAMPDPQAVGSGLSEALITTAAGLAVAMPSLIFHNFFMSLSDKHISWLEKYHREFEIHSEELESTMSDTNSGDSNEE